MHIRKFDNLPVLIAQDKIPNTSYQQEKLNNTASATQATSATKTKINHPKTWLAGAEYGCADKFCKRFEVSWHIHVKFCNRVRSEHK